MKSKFKSTYFDFDNIIEWNQNKIVLPLKNSQRGIWQFEIYNFFETGCVLNDYISNPIESFILPLCVHLQVKVLLFQQNILSSQAFNSTL